MNKQKLPVNLAPSYLFRSLQIAVAIGFVSLSVSACSSTPSSSSMASSPTQETAQTDAAKPDSAKAGTSPEELTKVIAEYKAYVVQEVDQLAKQTQTFTQAVKSNDLSKAKSVYAGTRMHYERIEPAAELFSDLDGSIDARADDYAKKEQDPQWTGFHRIELALFKDNTTQGMTPLANHLLSDVQSLQSKVNKLEIKPKDMVGGAADLIEEVSATKITGEEDRYSGADLSDFQANLDGSEKIVDLLRPMIQKADPKLLSRIDENFKKIDTGIAKYKDPNGEFNGYVNYKKLTEDDRKDLQATLAALAEDLSLLRGTLGVE